jgi:LysR family transcriptional regulator (chromosome initiation inhibitor)
MHPLIYLMSMEISNTGLSAFIKTASILNITAAAKELGITQSALSQRIALLEDALETTLFIREARGLKLTERGEKLLQFALLNQKLEEEFLNDFKSSSVELAGTINLAGYSSVMRSVIIPALSPFLRKNPKIQISFQSYEMGELPNILKTAKADIIFTDYLWEKNGIINHQCGHEKFVVIESTKFPSATDIYLDHGPEDNATEEFFRHQSRSPKILRRSFMGDVYGIIDGVEKGLGMAVMSKHLIAQNKAVTIKEGYKKYVRPVTMHYYDRPYFSKVMSRVLQELQKNCAHFLS